ncbi:MAG: transposase [Acidobacteriales bacterium]|nr:transposase [Terriglobales bacterium]
MISNQPNLGTLAKRLTNEQAARKFLEDLRWSKGAECPPCGESFIGSNALSTSVRPLSKRRHRAYRLLPE